MAMPMFKGPGYGIDDNYPTDAAASLGSLKESGRGRKGASGGIAEYLETKPNGFSI